MELYLCIYIYIYIIPMTSEGGRTLLFHGQTSRTKRILSNGSKPIKPPKSEPEKIIQTMMRSEKEQKKHALITVEHASKDGMN